MEKHFTISAAGGEDNVIAAIAISLDKLSDLLYIFIFIISS